MKKELKKTKRYILGLLYSLKYELEHRRNQRAFLKNTKYIIYKYLPYYSIKKYLFVKSTIEHNTIDLIKIKNKIKIAFIVYSFSMWFLDELYNFLNNDDKFEVSIIIGHIIMENIESSNYEYKKTEAFFKKNKYVIKPAKAVTQNDILFFQTPYKFYEDELNIENISLNHLIFHTSYSYMLAGNKNKLFLDMYHWAYAYYTDSQFYLNEIIKNVRKYSNNAKYLGFPKMDSYYNVPERRISNKTTIIYSPHHSVNYTEFKSATFEENYRFFLFLVNKYKNKVHWIYKAHPLLRDHSIKAQIFKTFNDYDNYIRAWEKTGCVTIASDENYFELFKASDAMITDSVSFLAEYQFTNKPLLLLMSGKEKYNEFGESLIKVLYKCRGSDYKEIENYIQDIINKKDPMYNIRKEYFKNNLDYLNRFSETANYNIYKDIIDTFAEQKEQ